MSLKQLYSGILSVPDLDTATREQAIADIKQANKKNYLALPALYREFVTEDGKKSAIDNILTVLSDATYLHKIAIGLDCLTEKQWKETYGETVPYVSAEEQIQAVLKLLSEHEVSKNQNITVIPNNDAAIEAWRNVLASEEYNDHPLMTKSPGKGRNFHKLMAWTFADMEAEGIDPKDASIVIHDCDITEDTYTDMFAIRLFHALAEGAEFAKANYERYTDKLNGRVSRVLPSMIDSIQNTLQGKKKYNKKLRKDLEHLRSFNYMFSGEMGFSGDFLKKITFVNNYSMEINLLHQARKLLKTKIGELPKIWDVEIRQRYDHHHQGNDGLNKMVTQITAEAFRIVGEQFKINDKTMQKIQKKFAKRAKSLPEVFQKIAKMNGLTIDMDAEKRNVKDFVSKIPEAFKIYQENEMEKPAQSIEVLMQQSPKALSELYKLVKEAGGDITHKPQPKQFELDFGIECTPDNDCEPAKPVKDFVSAVIPENTCNDKSLPLPSVQGNHLKAV
jgi:hypothetical protein